MKRRMARKYYGLTSSSPLYLFPLSLRTQTPSNIFTPCLPPLSFLLNISLPTHPILALSLPPPYHLLTYSPLLTLTPSTSHPPLTLPTHYLLTYLLTPSAQCPSTTSLIPPPYLLTLSSPNYPFLNSSPPPDPLNFSFDLY